MSTVVHMTSITVREQCPYAEYSTYPTLPALVAYSVVPVAAPCALYCLGDCHKGIIP